MHLAAAEITGLADFMHDPCTLQTLTRNSPADFTSILYVCIAPFRSAYAVSALEWVAGCTDTCRSDAMDVVKPMTGNHEGRGGREVAGRASCPAPNDPPTVHNVLHIAAHGVSVTKTRQHGEQALRTSTTPLIASIAGIWTDSLLDASELNHAKRVNCAPFPACASSDINCSGNRRDESAANQAAREPAVCFGVVGGVEMPTSQAQARTAVYFGFPWRFPSATFLFPSHIVQTTHLPQHSTSFLFSRTTFKDPCRDRKLIVVSAFPLFTLFDPWNFQDFSLELSFLLGEPRA